MPDRWSQYEVSPQPDKWAKFAAPSQSGVDTNPDPAKTWKAGVYSQMIDTSPGYAYQNLDEIDKQIREKGGDDFDKGIGYAIETGFEDTPIGLILRGKAPDPFESTSHVGNFIHDVSEMVSDPLMLASAFTSEAGVGIAGFAADAALRKTLMDQYTKGDVKSFGELTDRVGGVLWEGAKGALLAKAGMAAGEIPVGSLIAKNPLASTAVRGLYQSAVMTTAGNLLNGKLPQLQDFERSAALIVPLNMVSGGAFLRTGEAKQALMDAYEKTGVDPKEAGVKLNAQPHDPQDLNPGLRPSIRIGGEVLDGNDSETHDELADRLGTKPVTMEQLEADPALADRVLQEPETHSQDVIDKAWGIAKESDEPPSGNPPVSGRGFVTPDGKFLDRGAAKRWVKDNEPATHEMWEGIAGDAQAELHSEDYGIARMRVANRNVAQGEPTLATASDQLNKFLSNSREELNSIKAGTAADRYGKSVLRTLLSGPRGMLRAQAEQIVSGLRKLVPEYQDQEAISFMRDYRDNPDELRAAIEEVRSGSNEKLKALIPSMERALNPSPEMMQADQALTGYFTQALDLAREVGTIPSSSIDPSRYSPRLFMEAMDDAEQPRGVGRSKFTEKTPHAIRRQYLRLLDPLKSGEYEARTFNAFDEMSVYADRHATSIATKLFTTELKNSELGKWGSKDTVPEGWVELAPTQRGFHQSISTIDPETGQMATFSRGLYAPKAVADAMKPMLESGGLPSQVLSLLHLQNYVKAIELSLSVFHMKALTITAMNNMSFGDFARSLGSDNDSLEFQSVEREGAVWGLETTKTGVPYEAYKGLKPSSIPRGLDRLSDVPILKQVDALAQSLTHETFDVIQRKFKVMDFAQKQAAWIAKHPQAETAEYGSAMRGIAKEVNAAYGGLNWDVLGVSKGMRDLSRLFILAPDWTFSNVANLKYATEGGPAGSAARTFWVKSFATGIALSKAMSIAVSGQAKLDHPTSVYLGKDKDGKDMYSNWFFAGAPKDAITLVNRVMKDGAISGLVGFMANKFGPIAGTTLGIAENKQYGGKPITKPTDTAIQKDEKNLKFAGQQTLPVPFGIKDVAQMLMDSDQHSKWDYVLPLLGTYATHDKQPPATTQKQKPFGSSRSKRRFSLTGK